MKVHVPCHLPVPIDPRDAWFAVDDEPKVTDETFDVVTTEIEITCPFFTTVGFT